MQITCGKGKPSYMTVDTRDNDRTMAELYRDMDTLTDDEFELKWYMTGHAAPRYPLPVLIDRPAMVQPQRQPLPNPFIR